MADPVAKAARDKAHLQKYQKGTAADATPRTMDPERSSWADTHVTRGTNFLERPAIPKQHCEASAKKHRAASLTTR